MSRVHGFSYGPGFIDAKSIGREYDFTDYGLSLASVPRHRITEWALGQGAGRLTFSGGWSLGMEAERAAPRMARPLGILGAARYWLDGLAVTPGQARALVTVRPDSAPWRFDSLDWYWYYQHDAGAPARVDGADPYVMIFPALYARVLGAGELMSR